MNSSFRTLLPAIAAGLLASTPASVSARDWPQWRGPQRNGISAETGLLREWPAAGPKLLWQTRGIGEGYSTPSETGERLFLLSNRGLEDEFVQALTTEDGKQVWSTRLGKVGNPDQRPNYPAARSTPTVDGELLYALGSDGDLACLETATGKARWVKSLRGEFGGQPGKWAYAESPLIDGDLLVCTPGGAQATLVALNKRDGKVVWKCATPEGDPACYASVVIGEIAGRRQYVQFLHHGVVGVDATTGDFLWRYAKTADGRSGGHIQTPIVHRDRVYSAAGLIGGGLAHIRSSAGEFTAESVYFSKKLPIGGGGVVLVDGYLYGTSGPALQCVDFMTGTVKWEDRCVGAASVCYADGGLYVRGENGEVALVEASPEAYRQRGRFTLPDQPDRGRSKAWAYPVVANGRLYLRDLGTLWCYDLRP